VSLSEDKLCSRHVTDALLLLLLLSLLEKIFVAMRPSLVEILNTYISYLVS